MGNAKTKYTHFKEHKKEKKIDSKKQEEYIGYLTELKNLRADDDKIFQIIEETLMPSEFGFETWAGDLALKADFVDVAVRFLYELTVHSCLLESNTTAFPKNLVAVIGWLVTCSEQSKPFSLQLSKTTYPELVIRLLKTQLLHERQDIEEVQMFTALMLGTIQNMSRHPCCHDRLREVEMVQVVEGHADFDLTEIQIVVAMIKGLLYTEDELREMSWQGVTLMVDILRKALQNDGHWYKEENWLCLCFCAEEIAEFISIVAANQTVAQELVGNGVTEPLQDLMENGNSNEKEMAGKALWAISMSISLGDRVENRLAQLLLGILSNTTDHTVKNIADGMLLSLTGDNSTLQVDKRMSVKGSGEPVETSGSVFVSYSQMDSEAVQVMFEGLQEAGYTVFNVPADHESASVQKAVPAIKACDVVIICVSQSYKTIPICRAVQEGSQMVIEHPGAVNELTLEQSRAPSTEGKQMALSAGAHSEPPPLPQRTYHMNIVKVSWTTTDVARWVEYNDLTPCKALFEEVEGTGLVEMINMYQSAPEYFLGQFIKEFNFSSKQVLALSAVFGAFKK